MLFVDGKSRIDGGNYSVKATDQGSHDLLTPYQTGNIDESITLYNDAVCNIYDLGSNVQEWTLTAHAKTGRAARGGNYASSYSPSYCYSYDPRHQFSGIGTRTALFVK